MKQNPAQSISIRKWQIEDAYSLMLIGKDMQIRRDWNYACPYPYTMKKAQMCIEFFIYANPFHYQIRAIAFNDHLCGWIQCERKSHGNALLTFWLHSRYEQESIQKEAICQMCPHTFMTMNIDTIYARVHMENQMLCNALIQNGFRECRETAPVYLYFLHRFPDLFF